MGGNSIHTHIRAVYFLSFISISYVLLYDASYLMCYTIETHIIWFFICSLIYQSHWEQGSCFSSFVIPISIELKFKHVLNFEWIKKSMWYSSDEGTSWTKKKIKIKHFPEAYLVLIGTKWQNPIGWAMQLLVRMLFSQMCWAQHASSWDTNMDDVFLWFSLPLDTTTDLKSKTI